MFCSAPQGLRTPPEHTGHAGHAGHAGRVRVRGTARKESPPHATTATGPQQDRVRLGGALGLSQWAVGHVLGRAFISRGHRPTPQAHLHPLWLESWGVGVLWRGAAPCMSIPATPAPGPNHSGISPFLWGTTRSRSLILRFGERGSRSGQGDPPRPRLVATTDWFCPRGSLCPALLS